MSTDPRPGMVRFSGAAAAFPVAICRSCDMVLPFDSDQRRMSWAVEHQRTGHPIEFAVDVRPDPKKPFAFITRETQQQHQSTPSWQAFMQVRNPLIAQGTDNQVVSMKPAPQDEPAASSQGDTAPKKLNARDRRRQRRKGLQQKDEE